MDNKNKKGKYIFGICKIGPKGQIVIPADARKIFDLEPGDSLIMFGDIKKGLALVKSDTFNPIAAKILGVNK